MRELGSREMTSQRLVVAYNFPPFNDGSAVTVAKRVVLDGRRVDVISADLSAHRSLDPSLAELVAPYVDFHFVARTLVAFSNWESVIEFVELGSEVLAFRGARYESVYSRSMWPHSHFLAAVVKVRSRARKWEAEFSDPILWTVDGGRRSSPSLPVHDYGREILAALHPRERNFLGSHHTLLEWAQFVPFFLADTLVFTNEQQREVMIRDAPEEFRKKLMAKSVISPHPTLPAEYYSPGVAGPSDGLRIGYFGNFYPNRGAGEFLEAWSSMPKEEALRISLDVYSTTATSVRRAATALGLQERVRVRNPLPFRSFLRRTSDYSALLVTDISTGPFPVASPFLPSKVSDYRGSVTPIMAVTLPGSPLDKLAVRWKARSGDTAGIRRMLVKALADATRQ